ncbi:hypothetical protein HJG60_009130 [Phyllostomus discolor]|uniref:Uncharacterized protein n=1 Tax=Phyllostomus discolor TaxID=89673 RepID=A0A833YPX9_9CHIR|nr:hypothetical protein HJG60_009130 [Phyllostomus discolor]
MHSFALCFCYVEHDVFAGLQFSASLNLQVTELREDMPVVVSKTAVQGRGLHVICSSRGRSITSAPGRSSTEGQSTPVSSRRFPERAFSLCSGLRLALEVTLPLFTSVKHSPFAVFPRQGKRTRHFLASSADLAVSKGGGHAEPHAGFRTVTCVRPPVLS